MTQGERYTHRCDTQGSIPTVVTHREAYPRLYTREAIPTVIHQGGYTHSYTSVFGRIREVYARITSVFSFPGVRITVLTLFL